MKEQISILISKSVLDYIDRTIKSTGLSRSASIETYTNIVSTYFTDKQVLMEASVHAPVDGRKKNKCK